MNQNDTDRDVETLLGYTNNNDGYGEIDCEPSCDVQ